MARRSRGGVEERGETPPSDRSASGEGGSNPGTATGDGALARIMAVEERLAGLLEETRERARAMVAEERTRVEERASTMRGRLALAEAALLEEIAAERDRRLAGARQDAERELARWTVVEDEWVEALAAWVVERVVDPAMSGDGDDAVDGVGP